MPVQTSGQFELEGLGVEVVDVDVFVLTPGGQLEAVGGEPAVPDLVLVIGQDLEGFTGELVLGTLVVAAQEGRIQGAQFIAEAMVEAAFSLEFCGLVEQS